MCERSVSEMSGEEEGRQRTLRKTLPMQRISALLTEHQVLLRHTVHPIVTDRAVVLWPWDAFLPRIRSWSGCSWCVCGDLASRPCMRLADVRMRDRVGCQRRVGEYFLELGCEEGSGGGEVSVRVRVMVGVVIRKKRMIGRVGSHER